MIPRLGWGSFCILAMGSILNGGVGGYCMKKYVGGRGDKTRPGLRLGGWMEEEI